MFPKVIVSGKCRPNLSRGYKQYVYDELDALDRWQGPFLTVLHFSCMGAPFAAHEWACDRHRKTEGYMAYRNDDGSRSAVSVRRLNTHIIDVGRPNLVICFDQGVGSTDLLKKAKAAGACIHMIKSNFRTRAEQKGAA